MLADPQITYESDGLFYLYPNDKLTPFGALSFCANIGFRLFRAYNTITMNVARNISNSKAIYNA